MPIDIAVDRHGLIYIYDGSDYLYQYDKEGNVIGLIQMDVTPWRISGNLEIINDEIYIGVCGENKWCGDMLLAKILPDKSFVGLTDKEKRDQNPKEKQRGFPSGRKMLRKSEILRQEFTLEEKNSATSKLLSFSRRVIKYMDLMGEDGKGHLYIKTGRDELNDEVTEVQKFNAEGEYRTTFQMPKGFINSGAVKYYLITKDGTLYDFLPQEDKLRITVFYGEGI